MSIYIYALLNLTVTLKSIVGNERYFIGNLTFCFLFSFQLGCEMLSKWYLMISLNRVQFLNRLKLFYCYSTDFNMTNKCFGFGSIVFQPDFQFNESPVFHFDVKNINWFSFVWNFILLSNHVTHTHTHIRHFACNNTETFPNFSLFRQNSTWFWNCLKTVFTTFDLIRSSKSSSLASWKKYFCSAFLGWLI